MDNENREKLKTVVSQWETAFYLSQAILDDYAEHISKAEGITSDEVKKRVMNLATKKHNDSKKK